MSAPERYIRMQEVAKRLGISYSHLRKLRCYHRFPLVFERRHGVLVVREAVLNDYITGRAA